MPWIRSSLWNHLESVQSLFDMGASIDAQDNDGITALMEASRCGLVGIVKLILENGADPNIQESDGNTALMLASCNGQLDIVKLLLDKGAQIDIQNHGGLSALMWACQKGRVQIDKYLLDMNAQIDPTSKQGRTSLHMVCNDEHLLERYVYINSFVDPHDKVELVHADKGAKVSARDIVGKSAVIHAIDHGNFDIAQVLYARVPNLE